MIARIPAALDPSTIPITPPIIERPAVQFNTPNALDGVPSLDGGVAAVHGPGSKNPVVCPHEQPNSQRIMMARETSIEMTLALATAKPP